MKFKASKNELVQGISVAVRAVSNKSTMPMLECILIEAREDGLILTGNDLDTGIETYVNADIFEQGTIAVEAKMFHEIIRKMPDKEITIETDDKDVVNIKCGKVKFAVAGRNPAEFTRLPDVEESEGVSIGQAEFREAIQGTVFALLPSDNTNKMMTGEYFKASGSKLQMCALDGHRVAIRNVTLNEKYGEQDVVIPGKALNDISRILNPSSPNPAVLTISQNHCVFQIDDTKLVTRKIDGKYFDIDSIINKDSTIRVTVDRNQLISCVERAGLFVREGDKKPIILEFTGQETRISITSPYGKMDEVLDVQKDGDDLTIGFNPHLMMDALKAIPDEDVVLHMSNKKSPCCIRDEDETYLYLVLPVNFVE